MVGLDALPTYKGVVAWFPGPGKDMECYFQRLRRLNQGLNTSHWRVYERKREPDRICLVVSIDSPLIVAWDKQYSLLGVKPKGRK
jgi:hypothetical protein